MPDHEPDVCLAGFSTALAFAAALVMLAGGAVGSVTTMMVGALVMFVAAVLATQA